MKKRASWVPQRLLRNSSSNLSQLTKDLEKEVRKDKKTSAASVGSVEKKKVVERKMRNISLKLLPPRTSTCVIKSVQLINNKGKKSQKENKSSENILVEELPLKTMDDGSSQIKDNADNIETTGDEESTHIENTENPDEPVEQMDDGSVKGDASEKNPRQSVVSEKASNTRGKKGPSKGVETKASFKLQTSKEYLVEALENKRKTEEALIIEGVHSSDEKSVKSKSKTLTEDIAGLKQENTALKRRVLYLEVELRRVNALNHELQKKTLVILDKVEETCKKTDEASQQHLLKQIANGEFMPPGYEDLVNWKVSAGFGVWIDKNDYDSVRYQRANTVPQFIKNIASIIFTEEVLKKSSVTGKSSNAYVQEEDEKKIALDTTKVKAVTAISRFWMQSKKIKEEEVAHHLSKVRKYIGEKIACLNRGSRSEKSTRKRKLKNPERKKKKKSKSSVDSANDASENEETPEGPSESGSAADEGHAAEKRIQSKAEETPESPAQSGSAADGGHAAEKHVQSAAEESVSDSLSINSRFFPDSTDQELENISDNEDFNDDIFPKDDI